MRVFTEARERVLSQKKLENRECSAAFHSFSRFHWHFAHIALRVCCSAANGIILIDRQSSCWVMVASSCLIISGSSPSRTFMIIAHCIITMRNSRGLREEFHDSNQVKIHLLRLIRRSSEVVRINLNKTLRAKICGAFMSCVTTIRGHSEQTSFAFWGGRGSSKQTAI